MNQQKSARINQKLKTSQKFADKSHAITQDEKARRLLGIIAQTLNFREEFVIEKSQKKPKTKNQKPKT